MWQRKTHTPGKSTVRALIPAAAFTIRTETIEKKENL